MACGQSSSHVHHVINLVGGLFGWSTNLEEIALYYPVPGHWQPEGSPSRSPTDPGSESGAERR
eukprot:2700466-Rhodomonas_salina.1